MLTSTGAWGNYRPGSVYRRKQVETYARRNREQYLKIGPTKPLTNIKERPWVLSHVTTGASPITNRSCGCARSILHSP